MPHEDTRFRVGHLVLPAASFAQVAATEPLLELVPLPIDRPEAALDLLRNCHGYYVMASRDELPRPLHVDSAFFGHVPNLLMVASTGAGYDTVDPDACTEAGVLLINQAGGNAQGVAEHAVGMMLGLLKRMPEAHAAMRAGRARDRAALIGRELRGRTVGIVGAGFVGTRVADILRAGFGCTILAADPYLDAATVEARGARLVPLPELLAGSDVVSVHCPLTPQSRLLFGAAEFAAMRLGALFVTTARGSIHDEAALLGALASGHLAGAGLDVWEQEPPDPAHPLLARPDVIATQHTAGVTRESRANIARIAAEAFIEAAHGRPPPRQINPEVAAGFTDRWRRAFAA